MSLLFSPYTLRSLTLRNRLVVSPMCQYSGDDGFANDWHLVHLGTRATGGAALVIQEATAVTPEGRISPQDLGIWKDEHIGKLKSITDFIHSQGAIAGIQLAHAGRKASTARPWEGGKQLSNEAGGWTTVAPSAVPFYENERAPHALDEEEIEALIAAFRDAAVRALKAGYKLVEIHAAHGYLIHQFLSPLSNQRTDDWGGSFENRIRFLLRTVDAVREVWPHELPLFVRISATDWIEGGWDLESSVKLATILKEKEVDLVDTSSGGLAPNAVIPAGPGYQVGFAETIRQQSGMPVGAVGIIVSAAQAETILQEEKADLIFMARELLRNPYFPLEAAQELGDDIAWPDQYARARRPQK
ncbi:NADPH dehydrogenase NamA [Nostoc ellipsosporum NOK]|jgi:2,4-dienoyl-CoA reductase-like NADH-dependent reductase (Old Yellow Enzyme family)|nr:NADPH dehydrogenase NamA [Nostoc ellipsosporum NOK]